MAGFEHQLYYVVGSREVMTDGEAEKFKRLNLLQWMIKEIERWEFDYASGALEGTLRFSKIEGYVPFIKPAFNPFKISKERCSCSLPHSGMRVLLGLG